MKKPEKKTFLFSNGKKITIYYISPFVAEGGPSSIRVDHIFYTKLSKEAQEAIIYHEMYHSKFFTRFFKRTLFILKSVFTRENPKWLEEYEADKFSAINCGFKKTLKFLNEAKKLYSEGIVNYDPKTHPPIEERIRRIVKLKRKNAKK